MEDLNMIILQDIQCPACREPMKKYIFICTLGHSLCGNCKKMISKCPICFCQMGDARNWLLESIACLLHYPCSNADQGCCEMYPYADLDEHENICIHRTYGCAIYDEKDTLCSWKGLRVNLGAHVKSLHPRLAWTQNESLSRWTKFKETIETQLMYIEEDYDEIFWLHRQEKNSRMSWCLQYIGSNIFSQTYRFEVHIFKEHEPGRFITLGSVAQPDILPKNKYFYPENCAKISMSIFQTYKDSNETVWYTVKILQNSREEDEKNVDTENVADEECDDEEEI